MYYSKRQFYFTIIIATKVRLARCCLLYERLATFGKSSQMQIFILSDQLTIEH